MITPFHTKLHAELDGVPIQYSATQFEPDALIARSCEAHDFACVGPITGTTPTSLLFKALSGFVTCRGRLIRAPHTLLWQQELQLGSSANILTPNRKQLESKP